MSEVNDVQPSSLSHLIGHRGVVDQVLVAMEAAWADGRQFDSALLVGGPGLGKSQLAHVIAAEMATAVRRATDGLSDRQRLLVNALFYQSPTSYDEVSRRTGVPVGSIGPTRIRTLKRLHRTLSEMELAA